MEECRSAFKILTGIPTEKRFLVGPRRRWEDNIIIDLKDISIQGTAWIQFKMGNIGEPL